MQRRADLGLFKVAREQHRRNIIPVRWKKGFDFSGFILWDRTEIQVAMNFYSLQKTFRRTFWTRLLLQLESYLLGVFQQR